MYYDRNSINFVYVLSHKEYAWRTFHLIEMGKHFDVCAKSQTTAVQMHCEYFMHQKSNFYEFNL